MCGCDIIFCETENDYIVESCIYGEEQTYYIESTDNLIMPGD